MHSVLSLFTEHCLSEFGIRKTFPLVAICLNVRMYIYLEYVSC